MTCSAVPLEPEPDPPEPQPARPSADETGDQR